MQHDGLTTSCRLCQMNKLKITARHLQKLTCVEVFAKGEMKVFTLRYFLAYITVKVTQCCKINVSADDSKLCLIRWIISISFSF